MQTSVGSLHTWVPSERSLEQSWTCFARLGLQMWYDLSGLKHLSQGKRLGDVAWCWVLAGWSASPGGGRIIWTFLWNFNGQFEMVRITNQQLLCHDHLCCYASCTWSHASRPQLWGLFCCFTVWLMIALWEKYQAKLFMWLSKETPIRLFFIILFNLIYVYIYIYIANYLMISFAHGPKAGWTALAAKFLAEGLSKSGVCLAIFLLQPALVPEIDPLGHWNTEKKREL